MSAAAHALGHPDAAARVADLIEVTARPEPAENEPEP
jgi:UDP-N-acetylglucosamine:LPS N-acetylglucosamine transferase